jgi:hypothetical protein
VVEAVHPAALANVQTVSNSVSSNSTESQLEQQQEPQQEQIKINSESVDEESEAGISDTPMPENIGSSPPVEYNIGSQENNVYSESSALKPAEDSTSSNPDVVVDAPAAASVETSPDLVQSAENTVTTQGSAVESAGGEGEEAVPETESVTHSSSSDPTAESSTSEEDVPMELESLPDNPPQIESSESSSSDSGGAIPDSPAEAPVEERIEPSITNEPEATTAMTTQPESTEGKQEREGPSPSDPLVEAASSESSSKVVQPTSTDV